MDKKSPVPVYYQLAEEIKKKIDDGVWPVGHCIDSERVLAEEYSLSRMTVRQAIGELVSAGILTREKGKGTFVCQPKIEQRNIMSFTEIMGSVGIEFTTEVITFTKIEADEELYSELKCNELFKIERLRSIKGAVIADESIYIPCNYVPDLTRSSLQGSFYSYLDSKNLSIDSSEASVEAILMNDYYKGLFRLEENTPLLKLHSKNYTSDEKLLFIEESIYRSDKYILDINISRKKGMVK